MHDRDPEFISPPFSVVFLTVVKVIVSALIVFAVMSAIVLVILLAVGAMALD